MGLVMVVGGVRVACAASFVGLTSPRPLLLLSRPAGAVGPYRQSERLEIYQRVAKQLLESGDAYPCFCTEEELEEKRKQAEAEGRPPQYDRTWRDADPAEVQRRIAAGEPYTVRFKVTPGKRVEIDDMVRGQVAWDADATVGDFILLRSSGIPVYNFCVAGACCGCVMVGVGIGGGVCFPGGTQHNHKQRGNACMHAIHIGMSLTTQPCLHLPTQWTTR